jgi:hypothetical protein
MRRVSSLLETFQTPADLRNRLHVATTAIKRQLWWPTSISLQLRQGRPGGLIIEHGRMRAPHKARYTPSLVYAPRAASVSVVRCASPSRTEVIATISGGLPLPRPARTGSSLPSHRLKIMNGRSPCATANPRLLLRIVDATPSCRSTAHWTLPIVLVHCQVLRTRTEADHGLRGLPGGTGACVPALAAARHAS